MALSACVLRAKLKKIVNFFEEKCIRVTWLEDFLTSRPGSFTALALPLISKDWQVVVCMIKLFHFIAIMPELLVKAIHSLL